MLLGICQLGCRCHSRLVRRPLKQGILVLISLLLSPALWACDPPRLAPIAILDITDIGKPGAPVTCTGTAHAYVDPQPDGTVLSWVEGDNMNVKNVSNKIIIRMLIEAQWQDVRGGGNSVLNYDLDFTDPAHSLHPGDAWVGESVRHKPGPKMRRTKAEFDALSEIAPKLRIHALLVTFSDGTTYSESPDLKERPW
jgi:hypothetical protein